MEFDDKLGFDTWFPPPYEIIGFAQWMEKIEVFFQMNIKELFAIIEGFGAPKDNKGKHLWKSKWIKRNSRDMRHVIR